MIRMKARASFILVTIFSLSSHAQMPVMKEDTSIYSTTSSLHKTGDDLVASISIDITRNLSSNESIILIPAVIDSLGHRSEFPSIYINSRKQHIIFNRELSKKGKSVQAIQRKNGTRQTLHYLQSIPFEKWMNHSTLSLTEKSCGC